MPRAWEKISPRGSDPSSLSRWGGGGGRGVGAVPKTDPHMHPSLPLGVRGGFNSLEPGSPLAWQRPGWLHCLTVIARVRVQRGLSQDWFSDLTLWDRMAWTPPALCRPALTGSSLTAVVRAAGPGWSSPRSFLGLTGVTSLGNEVSPQCLGPGGRTQGPCPDRGHAVCSRLSPIDTPFSHWE